MRPRAIVDLANLPDESLFQAMAEGLQLIAANAHAIHGSACSLAAAQDWRGASILREFAAEEAAKVLILVDAVRCPRQPQSRLAQHLCKFNDHLAKALYSQAVDLRPATFAGVEREFEPELSPDSQFMEPPGQGVLKISR